VYLYFSQVAPYLNKQCPSPPSAQLGTFDNSNNPDPFPLPATRVNKVNSLSSYWPSAWDKSTFTANQALNNLREGIFLYEVYSFFSLYYSNSALIANMTQDSSVLGLKVDLTTNRTYPGPSMNYQNTLSQSSNYIMNVTVFT
jgi:hypothetical protein